MSDVVEGRLELFPEGDHKLVLHSIEGKVSRYKEMPYTRLTFYTEGGAYACNADVIGTMVNIIAWRHCIGKIFTVRVKHIDAEGTRFVDARVIK